MTRLVRYLGGPLDGQELDVADWADEDIRAGVYQVVPGWADSADYSPDLGGDHLLWHYRGPVQG